jgi:MoaD family protein
MSCNPVFRAPRRVRNPRTSPSMITVKLFATLKDKAGKNELTLAFTGGTVGELLKQASREYPVLKDLLSCGGILVSVNQEFVKPDARVKDGDEVALMPPFSGGDGKTGGVRVQQGPFSLDQEIEALKRSSSTIGAIVTFLGTTRDLSKGKKVAKLEFEHYPGMAEKKLAEIRERAIREFGVINVTIIHRTGTLPVGENIVLIAVASAHRDEAFRACRFCIDELKRITPIWKKETTPEGEVWVEEHP